MSSAGSSKRRTAGWRAATASRRSARRSATAVTLTPRISPKLRARFGPQYPKPMSPTLRATAQPVYGWGPAEPSALDDPDRLEPGHPRGDPEAVDDVHDLADILVGLRHLLGQRVPARR